MVRFGVGVLVLAAAYVGAGCGPAPVKGAKAAAWDGEQPAGYDPAPIRVVCFIDFSLSTLQTRVSQPHYAEFDELLALLQETGGELAIGAIDGRSNRSLLRCRLDQRPLPAAGQPPRGGNAFVGERQRREYRLRKGRDIERLQAWRRDNQQRAEQFRGPLKGLLDRPVSARVTDIFGAIQRASLFLGEPETGWRKPPLRFALFVSDGIDDVRSSYAPLPSGSRLILVNGSASLGSLAALEPVRMENFGAAVRYLANIVNEKGE